MIGIKEMSPMMMSFGAHCGTRTGQTKAAVMRSNYCAGVEIPTRNTTNQNRVRIAPAAEATMPSTQADIARLRPPSAPAEASRHEACLSAVVAFIAMSEAKSFAIDADLVRSGALASTLVAAR